MHEKIGLGFLIFPCSFLTFRLLVAFMSCSLVVRSAVFSVVLLFCFSLPSTSAQTTLCDAVAASPPLSSPFQDLIQQSLSLSTHALLLHGAAPPMTISAVEWASGARTVLTTQAVWMVAVDAGATNNQLVFSTTKGELFSSDPLGKRMMQLTQSSTNQVSSRFWASATHVAFIDDKIGGLFVVPLSWAGLVTEITQPLQRLGLSSVVSFSPDGMKIAFLQTPQSTTLLLVGRVDGGAGNAQPFHAKQTGGLGVLPYSLAWSPESRFIAYAAFVGSNNFTTGFSADVSLDQDSNIAFTRVSGVAGSGVDGAIAFSANGVVVFGARLEPSPDNQFQCMYSAFPRLSSSYVRLSQNLGTDVSGSSFVLSADNFVFYTNNGPNASLWKQAVLETDVSKNRRLSSALSEPVVSILSPTAFLSSGDANGRDLFYLPPSGAPVRLNPSDYLVQKATFLPNDQVLLYGGPTRQMMTVNVTSLSTRLVTTDSIAQYLMQPLAYALVYATSSNVVFSNCLSPRIIAPSVLLVSSSSPVSVTNNFFVPASSVVQMDRLSPPLSVTGAAVLDGTLQLNGFCGFVSFNQPVNFTAVTANFVQGQFANVDVPFCADPCILFTAQINIGNALIITVFQNCGQGLSGGAIAGIVIGSLLGALLLALLLGLLIKRGRERNAAKKAAKVAAIESPIAVDSSAPTLEAVELSHKDLY